MDETALPDARSPGLPKPCWILLGLAALGTASAWAFLQAAESLNADTPNLEIPFFASVAAVLVAVIAIPVELVRSARRQRVERASRGKRVLFHGIALLVVLAGLGSLLITIVTATFPKC
jgi:hypothetical protein